MDVLNVQRIFRTAISQSNGNIRKNSENVSLLSGFVCGCINAHVCEVDVNVDIVLQAVCCFRLCTETTKKTYQKLSSD